MKPTKVTPLQNNRNHNNVCRWHRKRPQPWTWAQKHERRLEKGWNWKLLDAKWEKTKAQYTRCVPFALYKWKAFGFDGKQQPIWTIAGYVDMVENYEDPSDYVGMGWVGSDGRP
jgi:hypothetical protein